MYKRPALRILKMIEKEAKSATAVVGLNCRE
jgi:hypothetical protein